MQGVGPGSLRGTPEGLREKDSRRFALKFEEAAREKVKKKKKDKSEEGRKQWKTLGGRQREEVPH